MSGLLGKDPFGQRISSWRLLMGVTKFLIWSGVFRDSKIWLKWRWWRSKNYLKWIKTYYQSDRWPEGLTLSFKVLAWRAVNLPVWWHPCMSWVRVNCLVSCWVSFYVIINWWKGTSKGTARYKSQGQQQEKQRDRKATAPTPSSGEQTIFILWSLSAYLWFQIATSARALKFERDRRRESV